MVMEPGLVGRTMRTSAALALLVLVFGTFYYGFQATLSIFTGIIWGIVNLYFLSLLVRSTLRPQGPDKTTALVILFVKFPLLYASGYFMVVSGYFNPILLLVGFSVVLIVIVLKAFGRAILRLDSFDVGSKNEGLKSV
jgi:hypothetical protein